MPPHYWAWIHGVIRTFIWQMCPLLLDVGNCLIQKREIFSPVFCKVSKRIRNIAYDESLWLSINLCTRNVPIEFLSMIINNGCKYLNLFMAEINGTELKLNQQPQLKYLDISRLVWWQSWNFIVLQANFCRWLLRKYPLRGCILGVLTHTTALNRLWGGDECLKWVLLYAMLCIAQYCNA